MITQSDISADDLKRIDAAIAEYKEPAAKLRELADREAKQSAIVEKLRQQYEQAGAVDLTQFDDPDTIQNAKLKVSQLRDELSTETRLLQAITTATINTREGGKSAANHVRTVAERALLNAVSEREASTIEAFSCAAYELLALYVARHGAGHWT